MPELLITLLASLSVPAAVYLLKNLLEIREKKSVRLMNVVDQKGKEFNVFIEGKIDEKVIGKILENEYDFEDKIEKIFNKYKKSNELFQYHRNTYVDFIVEFEDKVIAIEAKSSGSWANKEYLSKLKMNHPEVSEMFFVFDSDVPEKYLKEYGNNSFVKFISSPRGKALSEKIVNVLDHESNKKHITRRLNGTKTVG